MHKRLLALFLSSALFLWAQPKEGNPKPIKAPKAAYPALARASHVQGIVTFRVSIGKLGNVERATLIKGHPILVNAAKEAVEHYEYKSSDAGMMPIVDVEVKP